MRTLIVKRSDKVFTPGESSSNEVFIMREVNSSCKFILKEVEVREKITVPGPPLFTTRGLGYPPVDMVKTTKKYRWINLNETRQGGDKATTYDTLRGALVASLRLSGVIVTKYLDFDHCVDVESRRGMVEGKLLVESRKTGVFTPSETSAMKLYVRFEEGPGHWQQSVVGTRVTVSILSPGAFKGWFWKEPTLTSAFNFPTKQDAFTAALEADKRDTKVKVKVKEFDSYVEFAKYLLKKYEGWEVIS